MSSTACAVATSVPTSPYGAATLPDTSAGPPAPATPPLSRQDAYYIGYHAVASARPIVQPE